MIFAVTTTLLDREGKNVWWFVEFDGVESVEELTEILIEDGIIDGVKLKLTKVSPDTSKVIGREPLAIGKAIIATITPAHLNIIGA